MAAVDDISGAIVAAETRPIGDVWQGYKRFLEGDVIFARITPCMENGKAAIATGLLNGIGLGSTEFHVLRPTKEGSAKWVYHFVRQQAFRQEASRAMTGTAGQLRVPAAFMAEAPIPIPPLAEQERIVARIEALFRQSRTAREALERIPPLLKRFRRGVLAAAFRGDLVPQDPADEPAAAVLERIQAQRQAPTPLNTSALPELPAGWVWTVLGALAEVRNGVTKGRDLSRFKTVEVPYLRVANVQSGYLDLSVVKNIKIKESELEQYKLQHNDVLFTEGGDRDKLGRGTVWRGEITPCIHQNHIFCARLYTSDILPEWVSLASQLLYARDYFWSTASQTVNLASTNSTNLRAFPLPLPPSNEQRRIVARIQELFARAEAVEAAVAIARRRLDKLEQAILARAFRGELVPQSQ
jgi:type I restriction enzyme S subunit